MKLRFTRRAVQDFSAALQHKTENESHMTVKDHVAELQQRHHALEKKITEALKHKSIDDLEIVELKRQKLHLKDEIELLQHGGVNQ